MSNTSELLTLQHAWSSEQSLIISVDASANSLSFISAVPMRENPGEEAAFIDEVFDDVRNDVGVLSVGHTIDLPYSCVVLNTVEDKLFASFSSKLHKNEAATYGFQRTDRGRVAYHALASTSGGKTRLMEEGEMQAWRGARVLSLVGLMLSSCELHEEINQYAAAKLKPVVIAHS